VKNVKEIKVHSFLKGGKKVINKDEANFVKLITSDGFLTLRKDHINWEDLPEIVHPKIFS